MNQVKNGKRPISESSEDSSVKEDESSENMVGDPIVNQVKIMACRKMNQVKNGKRPISESSEDSGVKEDESSEKWQATH